MLQLLLEQDHMPIWLGILRTFSLALLLSVSVYTSISCLLKIRPSRLPGHVKLQSSPRQHLTRREESGQNLFDGLEPAGENDGDFVDEDLFWRRVIPLRILFAVLIVTTLAMQIMYSIRIISQGTMVSVYFPSSIALGACAITAIMSIAYTLTRTVSRHSSLTHQLFTVSAMYFLHIWLQTFGRYLANDMAGSPLTTLEYGLVAVAFFQTLADGLIPCEPARRFDLGSVYTKAVETAIRSQECAQVNLSAVGAKPNMIDQYSTSILSRLSLAWVTPVLRNITHSAQIDVQDMPGMYHFLRSQQIMRHAVQYAKITASPKRWGTTWAILWEVHVPFWGTIVQAVGVYLLVIPLSYMPHIALQNVLSSIESGHGRQAGIFWAALLVLSRLGIPMAQMCGWDSRTYSTTRIQAFSKYLLFNKILTRNAFARDSKTISSGPTSRAAILNLMTVDAAAIGELFFTLLKIVSCQMDILLGATYVWMLLGPSGLWGISTLLLTAVPAYFITKLQFKIYEKRLEASDQEVRLLQEIINAISMIKIMAAERFWYKRVQVVRDIEFRKLTQARMLGFVSGMLYSASPAVIIVVAFAHYTLVAQRTLSATTAFTSIAVFDQLRPVISSLPKKIAEFLQEFLSAKRVGAFMAESDVQYMSESPVSYSRTTPSTDIIRINGTIAWFEDPPSIERCLGPSATPSVSSDLTPVSFKLHDVDVTFVRGQITLIAGKFGSGKSLMLLALLGEAFLEHGSVTYLPSEIALASEASNDCGLLPNATAYAPQTAWLQSQSIRENILFGLPMDVTRYRSVIHAVGLLPDLEILEDSDLTEIGERGKILSGGQKARVSLARAVYSRASILVLDDVISAVDANTSNHIVEHCFKGRLMQGRTVIIASHAVEALAPCAERAVFLEGGRVVWQGTGTDLLISEHMAHLATERPGPDSAEEVSAPRRYLECASGFSRGETTEGFEIREAISATPRQMILEEVRSKGSVKTEYWWEMIWMNGGIWFYLFLAVLLLASCLSPVLQRRVLELWTNEGSGMSGGETRVIFWVALYAGLSGATILFDTAFGVCRFFGALRATKQVQSEMLSTVLCAKMSFFTRTRAGSIIQRFGKDLTDVLACAECLGEIGQLTLHVVVALISVTLYGGWIFLIMVTLVFMALYKPLAWYKCAGLQVRRLDAVLPGPTNAIYAETIAGATVIRAFGVQSTQVNGLLRNLNLQITTWCWRMYIARWLQMQFQLLDVTILATSLFIIFNGEGITAASAGFVLAFAGTVSANSEELMRQVRNFELSAVSLERCSEFRHLETEDVNRRIDMLHAEEEGDASVNSEYRNWPSTGRLDVKELSVRYAPDLPDILHDLSFSVESGERVGIVGASGCGKSTLAKSLFSFVEATHGQILIDGKDIANIPLSKVRSELGMIAQDPILLSGTLRLNLDIEGKYTDGELYDALHQVQLIHKQDRMNLIKLPNLAESEHASKSVFSSAASSTAIDGAGETVNIFTNLDYDIASGGENLSAGQKQLVVLARALLKKHRILIMDEATASLDSETDADINRVVHEEFVGATILIIAHRLRTVIPCSKILVMDKGTLVQEGPAYELIREEGKFKQLCLAAGEDEYQQLVALAAWEAAKTRLVDV